MTTYTEKRKQYYKLNREAFYWRQFKWFLNHFQMIAIPKKEYESLIEKLKEGDKK